jgi:SGNH domain (fused to AT3 domains)
VRYEGKRDRGWPRYTAFAVAAVVVVLPVVLLFGGSPALAGKAALTQSQLAVDLSAAIRMTTVPANVTPPLATAAHAKPLIVLNGCSLQHPGVESKPCVYGDRKAHISVALFGDSHAAAWFPALDLIAEQQHWRVVDFTKAGCPAAEVNITFGDAPYTECTAWRHNAEAQIAAIHPALVIVSEARWLELVAHPEPGVPRLWRSAWLNGLSATLSFLRTAAKRVVFISDVPLLASSAPSCVSAHMLDAYQCATERSTAVLLPAVKAEEVALLRREHVSWIDPTSWFCAPTACPAIVGNILVYRDNAHMTPSWSRFIAPVLADSILPIVRARIT